MLADIWQNNDAFIHDFGSLTFLVVSEFEVFKFFFDALYIWMGEKCQLELV